MKLFLKLDMTNDAFVGLDHDASPSFEAARILRELAKRIEAHSHFSPGHENCLLDANGNEVGFAGVYEDNQDIEIITKPDPYPPCEFCGLRGGH